MSSHGSADPLIASETRRLGHEVASLTDELVARLLDPQRRTSGYRDVPDERLREYMERGMAMLIERVFFDDGDLRDVDRELAIASTRDRLAMGLAPADILNSLSRSIETLSEATQECESRLSVHSETAALVGNRLMAIHRSLIDVMTSVIQETGDGGGSSDRSAVARTVVELFEGRHPARADVVRATGSVGALVPFRARGPAELLARLEAGETESDRAVAIARVREDLAGLGVAAPEPVGGLVIGVGPSAETPGLPAACAEASYAVDMGFALGLTGTVSIGELGPRSAVVTDPDLGDRMLSSLMAPLESARGRTDILLEAVEAWFEHRMNIGAAAFAIGIHANTLRYRLHRFERITDLDLQSVDDLVSIWWALQRRRAVALEQR